MAGLSKPWAGAVISQPFNGKLSGSKQFFQNYAGKALAAFASIFPGSQGSQTPYHGAIDWQAPLGTPIHNQVRAKVINFGKDSVSKANFIALEVRPRSTGKRVTIEHWHLNAFPTGLYLGKILALAAIVGYVGHTGWASGNHDHNVLKIEYTDVDGKDRIYLYNLERFLTGGDFQNDPAIRPYY